MMARGRDSTAWWHTASLMAALANCHRDTKKRSTPFRPAEFHPYERKKAPKAQPREMINTLTATFVTPEEQAAAEKKAAADKRRAQQLADRMRKRKAAA